MVTLYVNNDKKNPNVGMERINKSEEISEDKEFENIKTSGNLSDYIEKFLYRFEKKLSVSKISGEPTVKVSEVLGGLARIYERIRTTVEYKGEHVLRRNAIERILKRLVWEQGALRANIDNKRVAQALVKEMIWARYLPNNTITKSKVESVEIIVSKYLYLLRNLDNLPTGTSPAKIRAWIWGIASSEIEDLLDPSYRELYVKLMYDWFCDYFNWKDTDLDDHNKEIQIYLAIHRAFPKSDDSIMRYHLLLREFPEWINANKELVNNLIIDFPKIYDEIENHLNYPGRFNLFRKVQKHSAAFEIFHEIANVEKLNLRKLINNKDNFRTKIRDVCEIKYRHIKERVNTGIIRSIIYIFITKVVLAMLIEIPYEIFSYGDVRYLPMGINILFPPIMMFLIGMSIRIPGAKNTESIISRLDSVVYHVDSKSQQDFSILKSGKNSTTSVIFSIIYSLLFILVFGGITYVLTMLNFSVFGILIFFIFLSLVMLFAFRVRFNANQIRIDSETEGFFGHIASYLTLPFLNVGFYLSRGLAKLNFFTILLDFLIEVPLKNIIEIFEEWSSFIREKKEEVIEIPE